MGADELAQPSLIRRLGLFDTTMMLMGIVIGSGIFLTTGIMAKAIPSPGLILLAWVVGGLLSLAGALTFAELGAAMPDAGGQYVYLKEAYGPLSGFLYGWLTFLVYMTGSVAAVAVAFAEYLGYFFPRLSVEAILLSVNLPVIGAYTLSAGQLVALSATALFTLFNYVGVGLGKNIQNGLTVVKTSIILLFVGLGLTIGSGQPVEWVAVSDPAMGTRHMISAFGVALIAVLWAFDGWSNINFVAGEIRKPQRNLPLSLLLGTGLVMVIYLLVNTVYLYALPIPEMAGVVRIAEAAASALFGTASAGWIAAMVIITVLGALHGTIFAGARVYYAMAKDGLFFTSVARVHPRFKTPSTALVVQAVWAGFLTLTGSFEQLFTFVMFMNIAFWVAAAAAVFTLRRKLPDLPRPYETWGYPVVPILFILASGGLLVNTLLESPVESLAGIGMTLIGIPVYYYWRRRHHVRTEDITHR